MYDELNGGGGEEVLVAYLLKREAVARRCPRAVRAFCGVIFAEQLDPKRHLRRSRSRRSADAAPLRTAMMAAMVARMRMAGMSARMAVMPASTLAKYRRAWTFHVGLPVRVCVARGHALKVAHQLPRLVRTALEREANSLWQA